MMAEWRRAFGLALAFHCVVGGGESPQPQRCIRFCTGEHCSQRGAVLAIATVQLLIPRQGPAGISVHTTSCLAQCRRGVAAKVDDVVHHGIDSISSCASFVRALGVPVDEDLVYASEKVVEGDRCVAAGDMRRAAACYEVAIRFGERHPEQVSASRLRRRWITNVYVAHSRASACLDLVDRQWWSAQQVRAKRWAVAGVIGPSVPSRSAACRPLP